MHYLTFSVRAGMCELIMAFNMFLLTTYASEELYVFIYYSHISEELHVRFTDLNYYENEDDGCLQVVVSQVGVLSEDVVVSILPMTYWQFHNNSFTLPRPPPFNHLPPPAEGNMLSDYIIDVVY